jgi:hypothetical protein
MRTTLVLPDRMVIEAKQQALTEGATLTSLIIDGLKARLASSSPARLLPVSQASGGLVAGANWERLTEPDGAGDIFR